MLGSGQQHDGNANIDKTGCYTQLVEGLLCSYHVDVVISTLLLFS